MAKDGSIHKNYKEIKILCTDNSEFITRSTYNSANSTLRLEIDPSSHPAWNPGVKTANNKQGEANKFSKRFDNLDLLG